MSREFTRQITGLTRTRIDLLKSIYTSWSPHQAQPSPQHRFQRLRRNLRKEANVCLPSAVRLEVLLIDLMIDGVTIDDDLLLEIFDWYLLQAREEAEEYTQDINAWHTLVHVCQRWRTIVFGSPHRLNLRLFFTEGTPIRKTLAVWPSLPIIMWQSGERTWDLDDIIWALDYSDRIREIKLTSWISQVPSWYKSWKQWSSHSQC